ncbi:plasma-membrane proton-efflux P-type ATPase [archaeon]|nr:MAG: plasma-membrane proton-efflux P-type ATPase [archaeon]
MPIMIWIASITEAGIQNWPDMAILLTIQFVNASLGYYEITKAGDAVAALKASLKPLATVKRDGKWKNIDAAEVVPGDMVLLASGSAVPADCLVNEGTIEVDQSALTGESLPVTMYKGSSCKMGSNVVRGEVEGTVEFTGSNTFFGKTASLLQGDEELGNLQKVLLNIVIVLVILSFFFSGIVFGYLLGSGEGIEETISFTVVLIVASIPVAIEIVCTTTLALGSKELSKQGAIVTRLAAIEDMAGMTMLCSDKTGTLTMNKMMIQTETPVYAQNENQYSILRYAAMAAKWHEPARDALDTMVLSQADLKSLDAVEQLDYMPFDPIVKRTEGTVRDKKTGKTYKTTKGAPHVILKLTHDEKIKHKVEHDVHTFGGRGIRALAVAKTDENGVWHMLGLLTFLDPPRHDTKETIHRAISYGVEVKMITGDHLLIAMETARMLDLGDRVEGRHGVVPLIRGPEGLPMLDPDTKKAPEKLAETYGDYIRSGHGFAQVYPEHKFLIVQCLREMGFKTGMTGDGVNDAPALKRADVGIAVAGATDAARAASDIVLTQEGLSTIVEGIIISRCIFQRMKNFITYRIAATLQLLIFFFIAVLSMKPSNFQPDDWATREGFGGEEWPSYFKLPVLMLMLITLLNDGTLISIGYDNVNPSRYPNVWNLPVLFLVSSVLAAVALFSSLILLFLCLNSWHEGSLMYSWGIGKLSYGQITTIMYLKVSISDFLTLFSARTHDGFFWSSTPSPILLIAALFSLTLSTILACAWPDSNVDDQDVIGLGRRDPKAMALYVWLYCIFWWFVQDAAKVILYIWMEKYNIFGINDSLMINSKLVRAELGENNPLLGDEEKGASLNVRLLGNPDHRQEHRQDSVGSNRASVGGRTPSFSATRPSHGGRTSSFSGRPSSHHY